MYQSVKRALAFALVGTLAIITPIVGALAAVPFAIIVVLGRLITDGPVFDVFARPSDRVDETLHGLVGFSLAITGLLLLPPLVDLPVGIAVAVVLLVGYGNLAERVVCEKKDTAMRRAAGFSAGGITAAIIGQVFVQSFQTPPIDWAIIVFYGIIGTLIAATLRAIMGRNDDAAVMFSVGMVLWVFAGLGVSVESTTLIVAIGVVGAFGYLSYLLGTASVTGMFTGIIMGLLVIVLGGYAWFILLIAFFGLGGIASKYRFDEKRAYGVAEDNRGARRSRNVIGNALVSVLMVIGFAGSPQLAIPPVVFAYAFAGSVATAMSDTLSSEIGVLFGPPRLITTLQPVPPGTDGGVTLYGGIAGAAGALGIAVMGLVLFGFSLGGAIIVGLAGVVGMLADSVYGATLEGRWIGNQTVNFLATLTGAVIAVGGVIWFGILGI